MTVKSLHRPIIVSNSFKLTLNFKWSSTLTVSNPSLVLCKQQTKTLSLILF